MEILRTNIQSKYIEMLKEYILKILKNEDRILFSMILDSAHEKFKNIHKDNLGYNLLKAKRELETLRIIEIEIDPKSRIQVIRLARKKKRMSINQIIMKENRKNEI